MTTDSSTSTGSTVSAATSASSRSRALLLGGAGVLVATAANIVVLSVALAAGADDRFPPLDAPPVILFTVVGTVAALVGWRIVVARVPRSRRLLTRLVPILLVLSYVPDLLIPVLDVPPFSTPTAIAALLIMHTIVVAVAVPVAHRIAPAR